MLRTGQLFPPASHPASRRRTGSSLPGTLASPRAGLPPAGCPELGARLRHESLLAVMAPELLGAPPKCRSALPRRRAVMVERRTARHADQPIALAPTVRDRQSVRVAESPGRAGRGGRQIGLEVGCIALLARGPPTRAVRSAASSGRALGNGFRLVADRRRSGCDVARRANATLGTAHDGVNVSPRPPSRPRSRRCCPRSSRRFC